MIKPHEPPFLVRHQEPFWAYNYGRRAATCFLNYVNKNGKRSLRLHLQVKEQRRWHETIDQFMVIIPLDLNMRMLRRIQRDGPIRYQRKWTFKRMRMKTYAPLEHKTKT